MDINTLKKLAGIVEEVGPKSGAHEIAQQVFALAESRVADRVGNERGVGFDGTAVMREAEVIFGEIKEIIDFKLRNHKF